VFLNYYYIKVLIKNPESRIKKNLFVKRINPQQTVRKFCIYDL